MEETNRILPPEILSMIFQLLPASDILNCSLVCYEWREATNHNKIWKRLSCQNWWAEEWDETDDEDSGELVEGSRLSPLCPWHGTFNRSAHLYNNWKSGSYRIQKFDECVTKDVGKLVITAVDLDLLNIAIGDEIGRVFIWSLDKDKPELLESVLCLFKNTLVSDIFIDDLSFVVLQLGHLQVYTKSTDEKYTLQYLKVMIEDPNLPILKPGSNLQTVYDWFVGYLNQHSEEDPFKYTRGDLSFIAMWGSIKSVDTLSLKHEVALKTLQLPYESYKVSTVALLPNNNNIVFVSITNNVVGNVTLMYCLQKDMCLKQMKDTSTILHIFAVGNLLYSVNDQGMFTVWNYLTGLKLCELQISGLTFPNDSFCVVGNSVCFQSENKIVCVLYSFGKIHMNSLEVKPSSTLLGSGIGDALIVKHKKDIEIWDKSWKSYIKGVAVEENLLDMYSCQECIVLHNGSLITVIWF